MYGENPVDDVVRFMRAAVTDQVARLAPRLYVRMTGQTGRGAGEESAQDVGDYFKSCFAEYFKMLGVETSAIEQYLSGKNVLEYGPGDMPAVGLLMLAYGARSVVCVDRFPMYSLSQKNIDVLSRLMASFPERERRRAESCFLRKGEPGSGFAPDRLRYIVRPSGLSGLQDAADLIVSRAVLEHVDNLPATFADMASALRPEGEAIHLVDLKSHGLHRSNPLDFLTWPPKLWSWMYAHKGGCVNRHRVNKYREALSEAGLKALRMEPAKLADKRDIEKVRPHLARPFRDLPDEDLAWLEFWLVCRCASIQ